MAKLTVVFLCLLYLSGFSQSPAIVAKKPTYLPSALIDGRFYIKIPVRGGDTLLSFCDSGGGYNAIYAAAIKKLHLEPKVLEITIQGEKVKYIPASDVIANPDIPSPHIQDYYRPYIKVPFFQAPDNDKETEFFMAYIPQDAFLGQFFFIDHSWTYDYIKGKLYVNTPLSPDLNNKNIQQIGFKKNSDGSKKFGHASMKVEIDGEAIDVLFDTGASILLSKTTQAELQSNSRSIGGSFIAKSIFDNWRLKHPDWRFIAKGEVTGADMIQVPQVAVGTTTAGPVWFAKRPDEAWSKGMIGSIDKVVKGAVGGSLFQYYVVTIDYNSELVRFEKGK